MFLSTLTIADDMIAILVIAVFYTAELEVAVARGAGLALFAGWLWRSTAGHVHDLWPYLVVGLAMWVCFLLSGVHATIAGVLLALAVPARSPVKLRRVNAWFAEAAGVGRRTVRSLASPPSCRRSTCTTSSASGTSRA